MQIVDNWAIFSFLQVNKMVLNQIHLIYELPEMRIVGLILFQETNERRETDKEKRRLRY